MFTGTDAPSFVFGMAIGLPLGFLCREAINRIGNYGRYHKAKAE